VGPSLKRGHFYDQFPTTDHICICYGYAAVAYRRLQLSTVSYGHLRSTTEEMKFVNMSKITPRKSQDGGSVTVDPGTSRSCLRTRDGYPTDNTGLKPWRFRRPNRESENYTLRFGYTVVRFVWFKHERNSIHAIFDAYPRAKDALYSTEWIE